MYGDAVFGGPPGPYGPHAFRYLLWRCWEPLATQLTFILCNPSTAGGLLPNGELETDDTVDRLVEVGEANQTGGFVLVNLVAYVETRLSRSRGVNMVNEVNKEYIDAVLRLSNDIVVGWGAQFKKERMAMMQTLTGRPVLCIGINDVSRTPMHPLPRGPKRLDLVPYSLGGPSIGDP